MTVPETGAPVTVVGAGLAGSECAFQLAERGVDVTLVDQKPTARSPAHQSEGFAELVCSNSFRAMALTNAVGLLKEEMRRAGSLVMRVADQCRVPAGGALAVDRDRFSACIGTALRGHPRIRVVAREVTETPPAPAVIATGPMTGERLAADLANLVGRDHLAYYDAIAPVVLADSIDWSRVFRASRYGKGGDDAYVNCPLDESEYTALVEAVLAADKVSPREFEEIRYFEGCLPVEVMAERGPQTLAFGPLKPVGLTDPRTGRRPYAVVQLRAEDQAQSAYNLVGFQTRMTWGDQKRVLRMIPGLEQAEFARLGSVHRNTFVDAPRALDDDLSLRGRRGVFLAGQITGVEGYVESAACGLALGRVLGATIGGRPSQPPPVTTALGSLWRYLRTPNDRYQPSNILWSMFPPPPSGAGKGPRKEKRRRQREAMAERALTDLGAWLGGSRSVPNHPSNATLAVPP